MYISYNDAFCYINLLLDKHNNIYYFVQFVYQIKNMLYGIKEVNKFKRKKSKLGKLVYECIHILPDVIMHLYACIWICNNTFFLKDNKCLDVYIYMVAIITMIH